MSVFMYVYLARLAKISCNARVDYTAVLCLSCLIISVRGKGEKIEVFGLY